MSLDTILLFVVIGLVVFSASYYSKYNSLLHEYNALEDTYNYCQQNYEKTKQLYHLYQNKYENCSNDLMLCNNKYISLQMEFDDYKKETIKKTIPYDTLREFLAKDDTDEYAYDDVAMLCTDYSELLIKRLYDMGYFACETSLYYTDGTAHSIVALNVSFQNGTYKVMYVEPQEDLIIPDIYIGDDYCKLTGDDCSQIIYKITDCFEHRFYNFTDNMVYEAVFQ